MSENMDETQDIEEIEMTEEVEELTEDVEAEKDEESLEAAEVEEEPAEDVSGTELESFEAEEVEEKEFIEEERVQSILESLLFSTDKPQSVAVLKQSFRGTTVNTKQIRRALDQLMVNYAGAERGVTLEEVNGGFQLRTKQDNLDYLRRMVKGRPFKLSGPALEVLSIVAYKQPCAKIQVDEVRGVESGHLVRGLMEKNLLAFAGKSELPGKPMLYKTTKKFLEIFGLRNIDELPTLSEIDDLIPEGIVPEEGEKKETLGDVSDDLGQEAITSYSAATDELEKITEDLSDIDTSSDFFEQEKAREKARREADKANEIRERLVLEEEVEDKDRRWLERYDQKMQEESQQAEDAAEVSELLEDSDEKIEAEETLSTEVTETESSSDEAMVAGSEVADAIEASSESFDEEAEAEEEINEIEADEMTSEDSMENEVEDIDEFLADDDLPEDPEPQNDQSL